MNEEILAAITNVRKELEDLVQANVRNIYKAKYGTKNLIAGEVTVTFPAEDDTAYNSADDYEIRIHEAYDNAGIEISAALELSEKTTSGFKISSPFAGTCKWETFLKVPNFNFWT